MWAVIKLWESLVSKCLSSFKFTSLPVFKVKSSTKAPFVLNFYDKADVGYGPHLTLSLAVSALRNSLGSLKHELRPFCICLCAL